MSTLFSVLCICLINHTTEHSRANALETDPVVEDVQLKIDHQAQRLSTKTKPMEKAQSISSVY